MTEKHGNLKPLVDIKIRAPYLTQVRLIYNQSTYDKELDVRQTVQQFKKHLHETFQIPLARLRVFYVDDVAFNMGVGGPEELKYPQRLLHTYACNLHDRMQWIFLGTISMMEINFMWISNLIHRNLSIPIEQV